ncbi:MAG: hypothetical protein WBD55_13410 [Dehalococcoidia bacterium]
MSNRFYALWALAVALALIVPIAIPYALWSPPETGPGSWVGPADAVFGRWARSQVEGTRFVPNSVEVDTGPLLRAPVACDGPVAMHSLPRRYTATVTLRGPYGLPLESFEVTCSGWSRVSGSETSALALTVAALLAGTIAVSMPFGYVWLRHVLSRRLTSEPA